MTDAQKHIQINITQRKDKTGKNIPGYSWSFDSWLSSSDSDLTYAFQSMELNHSILSSNVTSNLTLTMDKPPAMGILIKSGQLVEILDSDLIVFQGVVGKVIYSVTSGGIVCNLVLLPSIYQLSMTPVIYDSTQSQQVGSALGSDVPLFSVADVASGVSIQDLLAYSITNLDYTNQFKHPTIYNLIQNLNNLGNTCYVMIQPNQSRDQLIRSSLDFYNIVFYQKETGEIVIQQLSENNTVDFEINVNNGTGFEDSGTNPAQCLSYEYSESAYISKAFHSSYGIIQPNQQIVLDNNVAMVTMTPNKKYYPYIDELLSTGWFTGDITYSQLNNNIVSDPTMAKIYQGLTSNQVSYINKTLSTNITKQQSVAIQLQAYQALVTAKSMASALMDYEQLSAVVYLEDPNLGNIDSGILGKVVNIQNSPMQKGVFATVTKSYSINGDFLSFTILPIGSITGAWV